MPNPIPAARRRWHATLIIALFFVAVTASAGIGWWYARESPPHQGPIVLIAVEAMQARRLHAYGAASNATPAIDALAADGIIFTRAYAHSPQTLPSHASLLTGQLPFEHGVRDDAGFVLGADARTLAEQLRNRGFVTGGVVSSFLLRKESGTAQGFSFFDGEMAAPEPAAAPAIDRDGLVSSAIAEQWMRMQDGQRYFLFLEVSDGSADAVVSRVVQLLKDRGLYDDSTIVVTAAHGEQSARAWLDDRSLAIPLIVKQPDAEGGGRNVATPVQHIDIVPTVLDLVRAPIPGGLRGRSLRPILDKEDGAIAPQPIYAEALEAAWRFGGVPVYSLTQDGYRLTRAATDTLSRIDDSAPLDPAEQNRLARMTAALDRLLSGRPVQVPGDVAPGDEAWLAASGYLRGLRILLPPSTPLDQPEQAALADSHAAAARFAGQGDNAAAIGALREIAHRRPDLAPVQFQIGSLLAKTGSTAEAIAAFVAASMLRPDDPDVPTALARVHLRAHQIGDARRRAAEAVALAEQSALPPLMADAYEVAMRVALAEPDLAAAAVSAQLGEKADPSRPLVAFVRGRAAYEEGRFDEALAALQAAAQTTRDRNRALADLHLVTGDTLARLDRFADAEAEFREELRAFPGNLQAYASLVTLYRAQNRRDAIDETIAALTKAAPTAEGYGMAARLWTIVGERAKADALRADARRRFRGDTSLPNN